MIGRTKSDVDTLWNDLIKVSNDEDTGKRNYEWLTKDERNTARRHRENKERDLKRQNQDDGFQVVGANKRNGKYQRIPDKNSDTFSLVEDSFMDERGGPVPIRKEIQANSEGVALVYDQASISSMVAQARICPHAGAVAIVGFRDITESPSKAINIVLQTKEGNLMARNVFIWNIGNVEVVRNESDAIELTGPKTVMMAFSGYEWHMKNKPPLPWAAGHAPMGKRPVPKAKAKPEAGQNKASTIPGKTVSTDPVKEFQSLFHQVREFPTSTLSTIFPEIDKAESVWGNLAAKRIHTAEQWANRGEVSFTVKVQDIDVTKWMKTSGDLLFCEPWRKE